MSLQRCVHQNSGETLVTSFMRKFRGCRAAISRLQRHIKLNIDITLRCTQSHPPCRSGLRAKAGKAWCGRLWPRTSAPSTRFLCGGPRFRRTAATPSSRCRVHLQRRTQVGSSRPAKTATKVKRIRSQTCCRQLWGQYLIVRVHTGTSLTQHAHYICVALLASPHQRRYTSLRTAKPLRQINVKVRRKTSAACTRTDVCTSTLRSFSKDMTSAARPSAAATCKSVISGSQCRVLGMRSYRYGTIEHFSVQARKHTVIANNKQLPRAIHKQNDTSCDLTLPWKSCYVNRVTSSWSWAARVVAVVAAA